MKKCYGYISLPEELGYTIDVTAEFTIQNDGIGHYEFWGSSDYDFGTDYPEFSNIIPEFDDDDSEEYRKKVLDYIDEHFDELADQLDRFVDMGDYIDDYYA